MSSTIKESPQEHQPVININGRRRGIARASLADVVAVHVFKAERPVAVPARPERRASLPRGIIDEQPAELECDGRRELGHRTLPSSTGLTIGVCGPSQISSNRKMQLSSVRSTMTMVGSP